MDRKSDKSNVELSATEASRSFSRLLDDVEAGGRFLIHRRGRAVCAMTPPPVVGRTTSECLAILRGRAPVLLDDRFGIDLEDVLATERIGEAPDWDS